MLKFLQDALASAGAGVGSGLLLGFSEYLVCFLPSLDWLACFLP
jgi:hypothetical protein